ncbi:MAG: CBS domain-containing protein [Cyanobacteria bacterium P01_H01_bin.15]
MYKSVAEIMMPNPASINPEAPLSDAIQLLAKPEVSALPVLDQQGKLVGIISETDLTWQETGVETPPYIMLLDSVIYLQNPARHHEQVQKALGQTVGEVMSDHPVSIAPDSPAKDAARLMHERKIHNLPVVDVDSQLVGLLTQSDIVRAMADS